jgi:hypothetical protein
MSTDARSACSKTSASVVLAGSTFSVATHVHTGTQRSAYGRRVSIKPRTGELNRAVRVPVPSGACILNGMEFDVVVDDTPLGVTFFDGLDIPLVEHVSINGAVHNAATRDGHRAVRIGDRLVAVNHKDVTLLPTTQVLTILAELSQRLRREAHSGSSGNYNRSGHEILLRFRAAAVAATEFSLADVTGPKLPASVRCRAVYLGCVHRPSRWWAALCRNCTDCCL